MTRQDLLILVAPIAIAWLVRKDLRRAAISSLTGVGAIAAWELFSLIYYGSLIPNTALAKLNTGLPLATRITQGFRYLGDFAVRDPAGLLILASCMVVLIAVRRVLDGRTYVSETVQRSLDQRAGENRSETNDPVARLSNREVQILNMIGRGMSSREIAQEFTLSVKTIESHRQTIKHKLGLATNSQLLQYAMKWFSGGTQRS